MSGLGCELPHDRLFERMKMSGTLCSIASLSWLGAKKVSNQIRCGIPGKWSGTLRLAGINKMDGYPAMGGSMPSQLTKALVQWSHSVRHVCSCGCDMRFGVLALVCMSCGSARKARHGVALSKIH